MATRGDIAYQGLLPFERWLRCSIDTPRWDCEVALLQERGRYAPDLQSRVLERVTWSAAVDLGDILRHSIGELPPDGAPDAVLVALQKAKASERGEPIRAFIASQRRGFACVRQLAREREPITEAQLCALHATLCPAQPPLPAHDAPERQRRPLPLAEFRTFPTCSPQEHGPVVWFAPAARIPRELQKFCETLRTQAFLGAHPVLQASYVLYGCLYIHPFADGNGRVARALASFYTYQSHGLPLLISSSRRREYLERLAEAYRGTVQHFVNFVFERGLDALCLAHTLLSPTTLSLG
jgi:hypothetical protein